MSTLQFTPFTSQVSPQLWHQLSKLKIDVLKLSKDSIPLDATYGAGRTVVDRETGKEIGVGCIFTASGDGFSKDQFSPAPNVAIASGSVMNFNTIEEFKGADKKALFAQVADEIWASFDTDKPEFNRFLLITFAELKKYKFFYWFAFPAFVPADPWSVREGSLASAVDVFGVDTLQGIAEAIPAHPTAFLVKPKPNGGYETAGITEYAQFFTNVPEDSVGLSLLPANRRLMALAFLGFVSQRIVAFLDPSSDPHSPGWPLLNILAYLFHKHPTTRSHRVLCWRDTVVPGASGQWRSRAGTIVANDKTLSGTRPAAVGWERNAQGKLSPRMADLGSSMDPLQLADQALGLNLKLMRWRRLPALNLEKVADTRCLLLGAGTLGCYVARTLLAWGVKKITFVDSAKVSFSNPARQPLFEFEDCLNGGRSKAECAAERLKKIYPGIDATGHSMFIPMPGHPIGKDLVEQTKKDVQLLEKLFDEHDVVFLLMDSRESRWLPSVLGASKKKASGWQGHDQPPQINNKTQIIMNAALGFDTFVVMRHGPRNTSYASSHTGIKLGCYFCSDVIAPKDSLSDQTLDQMCTVTRPGLASIASSTCVELLVSTLQHPDGLHAPAPPPMSNSKNSEQTYSGVEQTEGTSILGLVPHQIRGFLADFKNILVTAQQFERCTGCSEKVIQAYEQDGFPMLLRAFNEDTYLTQLTGLDKLYEESEAALADVDIGDDDDF
ncbi:Autophagy protein 7 [Serendipita sp. 399]|nr:Autophagy protein 7 [Serendipita sp. 399]